METILNITNGDCAVEVMKKAGIPGCFLPWRDLLHEGPVPLGLSLDALSKVRAEFISSNGWGEAESIHQDFINRDNTLGAFVGYEEVILWFEHDLYDQLQLLQILDWFQENINKNVVLSMVCTDNYLGTQAPDEMKGLIKYKQRVSREQLTLAQQAWSAFRQSTPVAWLQLRDQDTTALPFLDGAILRMLEEYPSYKTGLSRTARQALQVISQGELSASDIFKENQRLEERVFMGDVSFWLILQEFIDCSPALVALSGNRRLSFSSKKVQKLRITKVGLDVLTGKRNWLDIHKQNKWLGGVHLHANWSWCWQCETKEVIPRSLPTS